MRVWVFITHNLNKVI